MHDFISFYGLRSHGRLFEGGPVATSQVSHCCISIFPFSASDLIVNSKGRLCAGLRAQQGYDNR